MEKNKRRLTLEKLGHAYESYSYRTTENVVARLLHGFFFFKKSKAEILAGATTFFALLSFCPTMMLMISLLGYISGDVISSKAVVLDTIKDNVPHLAPWIYKSISNILDEQLKTGATVNLVNIFFLGYSLIGLVSAFMYGIRTIAQKKTKGGFIVDDISSFLIGSTVTVFMTFLLMATNKTLLKMTLFAKGSPIPQELLPIFNYSILPVVASLGFFTVFYKLTASRPIRLKDAFTGASAFVSCFLLGKSFHWIYLKLTKADMAVSYGNFYTLAVTILWVYFVVCSFFYGASVANVEKKDLHLEELSPQEREEIELNRAA
ncbi:YihY/virulence factor BrkB family protein [Bacteriovorax sp. DB6_IX]|uniref:YihY/virulence factor BrkB family protein n=1 Tax=Bacteriovorax sp. DB6_IX TaxID=1353530 RepID=UPI00038A2653|nr:YihY/virulence factor BrkB family protein [Bacteriovorax sp. DB6_IX]EQC52214.1 virulence factor BrkB [Bacteriovorax sp. DB6_IX]